MSKGVIFFKELSMPFDLITANAQLSSVLVFIPYSDKDIIIEGWIKNHRKQK